LQKSARRGRPLKAVSQPPHAAARPDVVATLRAAAPWQKLRKHIETVPAQGAPPRLTVRSSDFRYIKRRHPREATVIFAVDASGSTALSRLGEAKGAIELLLGSCYVNREQVALVVFRGTTSEILLEPTRSLVRAKRSLRGLPGGGPTPLASGMKTSREMATIARRRGQSPLIVLMSDGAGNVALDGSMGRSAAAEDAMILARQSAALGFQSIFIDIARRPRGRAADLAEAMHADYHLLPNADASAVSAVVSSAMRGP
jgi:magnesium chelatase subunit D